MSRKLMDLVLDSKEEFLSQLLARLNDLFITDELTDGDLINYADTVRNKLKENSAVICAYCAAGSYWGFYSR
jgi:hypothetical protein